MHYSAEPPLLSVRRVTKRFPGVRALSQVSLTVNQGEVVAVIGENGAGKSTLMKILAGIHAPDEGDVQFDGRTEKIDSVERALELGIALIHQELNLSDNLDVGTNIFLGREPGWLGFINKRRIYNESTSLLAQVGLSVSPRTLVSELPTGQQQMVEIAKAISVNARVLIMDEPTSSLSQHESRALFQVVQELRRRGVAIVYISNRLSEVQELADRVVVLRDGENAGELSREEISHDRMVKLMVGRDLSQFYARTAHVSGDVVLDVKQLVTPANPRHRLTFRVHSREIVGLAGLVGAGRTEVLQTLFGVERPIGGDILVDGKACRFCSPLDAIDAGIALVPEDRKQQGLILEASVRHNIGLPGLGRFSVFGFLNTGREAEDSRAMTTRLRIKTPSQQQVVQLLSGGNQQKVVLGKWLSLNPRVLLLDEPTRGIDIGAKQEIYRLMEELAQAGTAILFVSSEMEEVLGMSDRVLVMHEGRLAGELSRDQLNEEAVMHLATGGAMQPHATSTTRGL